VCWILCCPHDSQIFPKPPTPLKTLSRPYLMGRDSSVSIAPRYELDGPGSNPDESPPSLLYDRYCTGSFPGVERPNRGVYHSPRSSIEVEERVDLYLFFHSVHSWQVIGWNLIYLGARVGAVGCGTAAQSGRSRVRFSDWLNPWATLWPWDRLNF